MGALPTCVIGCLLKCDLGYCEFPLVCLNWTDIGEALSYM